MVVSRDLRTWGSSYFSRRSFRREGFTWPELLITLVVIGLLATLLLPGVQNSRCDRLRCECMNSLRNLGMAVTNYGTTSNGSIPPLTGGFAIDYSGGKGLPNPQDVPWTVLILPYLDQQRLYERLQSARPAELPKLFAERPKVFLCENDPKVQESSADRSLSYVANMGYVGAGNWQTESLRTPHIVESYQLGRTTCSGPDYAFNGLGVRDKDDSAVTRATGVFWRERGNGGFHMSTDYIARGDGQSQTILLAENLQAGGWSSYTIQQIGFGLKVAEVAPGQVALCSSTTPNGVGVLSSHAFSGALALPETFRANSECRINANATRALPGKCPRPSSTHPGLVNVMFVGGNAKPIVQTIDDRVYASLISSSGSRIGQAVLSETEF